MQGSSSRSSFAEAAPLTRDELHQEVTARAAADAAAGGPRATPGDLMLLYEKDAAALRMEPRELVRLYDDGYRKALQERSLFDRLTPQSGWIVAIITALLFFLRNAAKSASQSVLDAGRRHLYARFAGTRMFRLHALATYRRRVRDKYSRIILPFRPDRPLRMEEVYVPVRMKGAAMSELLHVSDCLRDFRRMVVVGNPGAGKSMLLKNIVYRYSTGDAKASLQIPVLIELYRLNEGETALEKVIVDVFDRNGFPRAGAFVDTALENGTLTLLFDGLDEVSSAKRKAVVARI